MAQQDILPTDAGDTSLIKIEANFTELYTSKDAVETVVNPASASAPASLDLHEDTDNGTNKITIIAPSAVASDKVLTLPDATDTLVGKDTTDTLTNKTLTSPVINAPTGITQANLSNPYKFRVWRNAAANSGNGAYAVIAFDSEDFDTGGNVASGVFTVPVNGYYRFSWRGAVITSGAESTVAALFVDGSVKSSGSQCLITSSVNASAGSDCVYLTADETVDIRLFNTATRAILTGTDKCFFSGELVATA